MKTDKIVTDLCRTEKLIGCGHGFLGQFEPDRARSMLDPERLQERKVVIDGVEKADRRLNKFIIAARPQPGPQFRMVGRDPFPCAGKKSEERRTIVPGKIQTIIEFAERKRDPV